MIELLSNKYLELLSINNNYNLYCNSTSAYLYNKVVTKIFVIILLSL